MPTINRQQPPKAPTTTSSPNGSLLSTAVPVTSLKEERVTVCLYGRNRSGKTTLASMFPKPLLFVSCEPAHCGGVQSVSNVNGVTLIRVENRVMTGETVGGREKILAVANELAADTYYNTVVLKTATSLQDMILEEMKAEIPNLPMMGRGAKDTWGMRAGRTQDVIRSLLNLKHKHVVIISQEKDHNPPTGEGGFPDLKAGILRTMQQNSFMAPSLGPGTAQWLQDACGYIVQIYEDEVMQDQVIPMHNPDGTPAKPVITKVGTGKRQRHLRLLYHANFAGGGKWQYDMNTPEFVTAPTPAGLYAAIAKYIPALK